MVHPHITSSLVILAPALVSAPAFSPAPGRRIFPAPPALADAVSMLRSGGARKAISACTCATARQPRTWELLTGSCRTGRTINGPAFEGLLLELFSASFDHAEPDAADARQAAARRVDRAGERSERARSGGFSNVGLFQPRVLPTSA